MFNPRKWFNLIMSSRQPMHTSSHRVVIRNNITIFPEVCSPCFCSVAIFQLLPFFLLCACVYVGVYVCVWNCMYVCVSMCLCVCLSVGESVCVCACVWCGVCVSVCV